VKLMVAMMTDITSSVIFFEFYVCLNSSGLFYIMRRKSLSC